MTDDRSPLQGLENAGTRDWSPTGIDTSVAHPARVYDYLLDGKDNFEADRAVAEQLVAGSLPVRELARANRAFLGRAVKYLAEQGIDQFLDIGTGIPSANNTHEVAQRVNPAARVVYVDNDPIVLAHARALMAGHGLGATTVILGDLRDPAAILAHPEVQAVIDFDRPVGLILVAVLHFIGEEEHPDAIVKTLGDALPAGSHLVLSHGTMDTKPGSDSAVFDDIAEGAVRLYQQRVIAQATPRSASRIHELLTGFELVPPGLVPVPSWRPEGGEEQLLFDGVGVYGAVGRKL